MKSLLTCLLIGCLVIPVWGQERNLTFEEFMQKLENNQAWTQENTEALLSVKLTKASSEVYKALGRFVYGKGLIVNDISYYVRVETNEMRGLHIWLDDKSSCFTQERIKKLYPGGEADGSYVRPGGAGDIYRINRGWGWLTFLFGDQKQWECLTGITIGINRVIYIEDP